MADAPLVYVGTYTEPIRFGTGQVLQGKGEGIYAYTMDRRSGALSLIGTPPSVANPSYLAFDASLRFLYAVNELKSHDGKSGGTVSAFSMNAATGELRFLNRQPTFGTDPCYIALDRTCRHALVANFMSGSVCVLPVLADGRLGDASDVVSHIGASVDPVRQTGPHAHSVTFDPTGEFAFVPDLGLDKVFVYRFDERRGSLVPHTVPWLQVTPGAGPRHIALHPAAPFAYLVNELNSTTSVLAWDRATGVLREAQVATTLPDRFRGGNSCADIQIAPSGLFVYASNRGHDSIAIFRVDPGTGLLTYIDNVTTRGHTPRSFCIDLTGNFLLVANQDSDTIVTFRIDGQTGMPRPTDHVAAVPTPVCVKIVDRTGTKSIGGWAWPR